MRVKRKTFDEPKNVKTPSCPTCSPTFVLVVWLRPGLQTDSGYRGHPVQAVRSLRCELFRLCWRHSPCSFLRAGVFLAADHSESVPIVRQAIRQASWLCSVLMFANVHRQAGAVASSGISMENREGYVRPEDNRCIFRPQVESGYELEQQRARNNPNRERVGAFTGRCSKCGAFLGGN